MKNFLTIVLLFCGIFSYSQNCDEYPCVVMTNDSTAYILFTLEQVNKINNYIDSYYLLNDLIQTYKEDSVIYVGIIDKKDKQIENYEINIKIYKDIIKNLEDEINHLVNMKSILQEIDKKQSDRINQLKRNQKWLKVLSGGLVVILILVII